MIDESDFLRELGTVPHLPAPAFDKVVARIKRRRLVSKATWLIALIFPILSGIGVYQVHSVQTEAATLMLVHEELQDIRGFLNGTDGLDETVVALSLHSDE